MTRYYYTDPLAAAYMVREFGVKIEVTAYKGMTPRVFSSIIEDMVDMHGEFTTEFTFGKYYLTQDSLSILQPQEGDIAVNDLGTPTTWQERADGWAFRTDDGVALQWRKIIQRQGKPFFWPESEEA